jgi:hypothetical protein
MNAGVIMRQQDDGSSDRPGGRELGRLWLDQRLCDSLTDDDAVTKLCGKSDCLQTKGKYCSEFLSLNEI